MSKKIKIAIISTILLTMLGIGVSNVIAVTDDIATVKPSTEPMENMDEKNTEPEDKNENQSKEKSEEEDKVEEKIENGDVEGKTEKSDEKNTEEDSRKEIVAENKEDTKEQIKEDNKESNKQDSKEINKEQSFEQGDKETVKETNIEKTNRGVQEKVENINEGKTGEDLQNNSMKKSMPNMQMQAMSFSTSTSSFGGSSVQANTETAVYNGSANNYLSSLEIDGETLNTTFNKENTTYFIQTEGKTELNVNAAKEDRKSKVYITGNTNLKNGENKILISVTAENGNVRYYRIYITNK